MTYANPTTPKELTTGKNYWLIFFFCHFDFWIVDVLSDSYTKAKKIQMVFFKKRKLRLRGFKCRFIFFQIQADTYWKNK